MVTRHWPAVPESTKSLLPAILTILSVVLERVPVPDFFINAGIYVLNPSILDSIDGKSYMDMPQLLERKIKDSNKVNMFPVHEYWLDIGQTEQLLQAQKDVSIL